MFQIEKAKQTDVKKIMEVFKDCTEALLKTGVRQWDGTYPTIEMFQNDIEAGAVFVIKNGRVILATITLNQQQDEQYKNIKWKFPAKKTIDHSSVSCQPKNTRKRVGKTIVYI